MYYSGVRFLRKAISRDENAAGEVFGFSLRAAGLYVWALDRAYMMGEKVLPDGVYSRENVLVVSYETA